MTDLVFLESVSKVLLKIWYCDSLLPAHMGSGASDGTDGYPVITTRAVAPAVSAHGAATGG